MNKLLLIISLAVALSLPTATKAQDKQSPEIMIEEGVKMVLQAFELILKTIPQYSAPEVLDNGDIIIRRVVPEKEKPKKKKPDYDKT
jgi:hypothetical protein